MAELITRELLKERFEQKLLNGSKISVRNPVDIVETAFGASVPVSGDSIDAEQLTTLNSLRRLDRGSNIVLSGKYRSGLEYAFKNRGSIIDRIRKGSFSAGNTLNDNWSDLYDAIRLDISIKKLGRPTLRESVYDVIDMPNASKDVRVSELFPYGFVFEENNGEGEAVRQGQNLGGQYETIAMKIYAAGYAHTLLAALFDNTYSLERVSQGIAVAESAKKDDLAFAPIIGGTYTGAKATAASTVGTLRQEKLYNTLLNAIDDLGKRTDPVTKRKIAAEGLVVLCSSYDANHINMVLNGLGKTTPENYNPLSQIKKVVGYDGETIDLPNKTVTYTGCTAGTVYLIKPSRYFKIPVKRNLTMEIDKNPDVSTLTREQRAWYFVESIFNATGIDSFVQKVTLPSW